MIELVLVASMVAVKLTAMLSLTDTTNKTTPKDTERAEVIRESQVGMHRMTRELRQAYDVDMSDSNAWRMHVAVAVNGVPTQVIYDCSEVDPANSAHRRCMRWSQSASGSTGPEPVVKHVVLTAPAGGGTPEPVFNYTYKGTNPKPVYVSVNLKLAVSGGLSGGGYKYRLALDDGFYLRNVDA